MFCVFVVAMRKHFTARDRRVVSGFVRVAREVEWEGKGAISRRRRLRRVGGALF